MRPDTLRRKGALHRAPACDVDHDAEGHGSDDEQEHKARDIERLEGDWHLKVGFVLPFGFLLNDGLFGVDDEVCRPVGRALTGDPVDEQIGYVMKENETRDRRVEPDGK